MYNNPNFTVGFFLPPQRKEIHGRDRTKGDNKTPEAAP